MNRISWFQGELRKWLDTHPGAILLIGAAASLGVNAWMYRKDRQAAMRLKQPAARSELPDNLPSVSFLVPAWDEAQYVEACIRSILALSYPNKELIVCAGGEDGTFEICDRYAGEGTLVLEQMPGEGKQGALQRCFERSSGEILFLTDADCLVDDACIEATLAPLLSGQEEVVTGTWQPFYFIKERPFVAYQWANHLRSQAAMPAWAETLDGRNTAIRRAALVAAGTFKDEALIGTDYVLSQKLKEAGYRICTVLASRVQTEYPVEIENYVQQGSRWYRNRLIQGFRFRQWRDVAASLWGAGASLFTLTGLLAWLLVGPAAAAAWLAALIHLGLTAARLAAFFRMTGFGKVSFPQTTIRFMGYTLFSDLAMIQGFVDSFDRRGRKAW